MKKPNIPLTRDTIDYDDLKHISDWILSVPRLTKGNVTIEFEKKWAEWTGTKYSIMVNSGSSANLLALYAAKVAGKFKNNKIIVPALSWATTVTPLFQLGFEPILCETDKNNLGVCTKHLEELINEHEPAGLILVHVLGFPCDMKTINRLCKDSNTVVIEDSCETVGSKIGTQKTGTFGLCSTFSLYFGHHVSTIEGGMICTDDEEIRDMLLMLRSHGWDRDLSKDKQTSLRKKYNVSDFHALYTFYVPAFNVRSTDLQAKIGLRQIEKLDQIVEKRNKNYLQYQSEIKNDFWMPKPASENYISSLAYPVITPSRKKVVEALIENGIETRPLVCGSIGLQPFWIERYGEQHFDFADQVHDFGLYVPNNHEMSEDEISFVAETINKAIK
tara:strand:+ start:3751 stop:4914 length:1164 start_codon:yes stop_codon:yes gene_type:complete